MYVCQPLKRMSFAETERVKQTIPFEEVKYGETFTNETYDIYGIDLPKGIKLVLNFFLFLVCYIFAVLFPLILALAKPYDPK